MLTNMDDKRTTLIFNKGQNMNKNNVFNINNPEFDLAKDKRKTYYLLVDVETAGGFDKPLTYDIGFLICDRKGKIYAKRSYLVDEIWNDIPLMQTAYYASKIPQYMVEIERGNIEVYPFKYVINEFNKLIEKYKPKYLSAYNLGFDKNALAKTAEYLNHQGKVLKYPIQLQCIWGMACETLFSQPTYAYTADAYQWYSEKGNYKTSAEMAYRYISGDPKFIEAHTGLADCEIEAKILGACLGQHKKYTKGILPHPWRLVKNKHSRVKKLGRVQ